MKTYLHKLGPGGLGIMSTTREPEERDRVVAICVKEERPTGDWSPWHQFGDVIERTRDAKAAFRVLEDFETNREDWGIAPGSYRAGDIIYTHHPRYFREIESADGSPISGRDICMWCGVDVDAAGGRQGYDCPVCGSN